MNLGDSGQRVPTWQAGEGGVVAHDAMRRQLEVVGLLGDCSEVLNNFPGLRLAQRVWLYLVLGACPLICQMPVLHGWVDDDTTRTLRCVQCAVCSVRCNVYDTRFMSTLPFSFSSLSPLSLSLSLSLSLRLSPSPGPSALASGQWPVDSGRGDGRVQVGVGVGVGVQVGAAEFRVRVLLNHDHDASGPNLKRGEP